MIILPTKGRPDNLQRFAHYYYLTKAILPVFVIFDAADAYKYNNIKTPEHWKRISAPAGTPIGEIFNIVFKKYPDEDYYAMVADDVLPETMEWDVKMHAACLPNKIVWGDDRIQREKLPVHPFIGGDLVRKLGWWAAPGLKHWFVDNVWKNITEVLGNGVYMPDVKMTHLHPVNGKAQMDRTYEEQPSHNADQSRYMQFMAEEFPEVIERLKTV